MPTGRRRYVRIPRVLGKKVIMGNFRVLFLLFVVLGVTADCFATDVVEENPLTLKAIFLDKDFKTESFGPLLNRNYGYTRQVEVTSFAASWTCRPLWYRRTLPY